MVVMTQSKKMLASSAKHDEACTHRQRYGYWLEYGSLLIVIEAAIRMDIFVCPSHATQRIFSSPNPSQVPTRH